MFPKLLFIFFIGVASSCYNPLRAQVTENFNDGNFTDNPTWTGNTADWQVNNEFQLQSNNTIENSSYYLSTANTLAVNAEWELYMKLTLNTSGLNYVDVFLTSSLSDLANTNTTGYFVRAGNTDDEISLYRKDAGGVVVKIIDGVNGILNTSNNVMKLKVQRAANNQWTLFRDITGTGNNYVTEGTVADATYTTSAYFGLLVRQSNPSFFQRHFFDDIDIRFYVPDVTPPVIQSVTATSANTLDILFNEPVDAASSQITTNYSVNNNIGTPTTATRDAANIALVHLSFAVNFTDGVNNTITANGIKDIAGNAVLNATSFFNYYLPKRYDVVIDEILADPTPVVSLPGVEFIELRNVSNQSINLQGFRISSTSTISGPLPSYILPADSFLILTSTSNVNLFTAYSRVLGVSSFPALDNTGTTLSLISKENIAIHSVSYNVSWYQNMVKSEGGWTLEMIDPKNPCSGAANWKASADLRGGTPGSKNSINGINTDGTAPALLRAAAIDSVTIILSFDEPLDSLKAATVANYTITNNVSPVSATALSPAFNSVQLKLNTPIARGTVYTITVANITDCSGNVIQARNTTRIGLPSLIDSFEVVINEILFNPKTNGVDFIEIYNRSNKIFDLKDMYIANRSSSTNPPASLRQLSATNLLMFPGDFYVISEDGSVVQQQYLAKNIDNFIDVSSMPSFPDDKGVVVLLNGQGAIIDELRYDEKWHFDLIDEEEGISLERIDYSKPTQNKENWHSAASTVGFATPGYQNSQFRIDLQLQGEVTITPKTFSPDNDGTDDFALINYVMDEPRYVANITIFDAAGRPVKALAKNATLALSGSFRWDGLDDKLRKVPVGIYIVYAEVFNLNGRRKTFKNSVVVASRF